MSAPTPEGGAVVTGVFSDLGRVSRAVRDLAARSVPADSIRVLVVDGHGRRVREVAVEDEAGALRGALVGAAWGAAVGLALVLVAALGVLGSVGTDLFGLDDLAGAVRAVAVSALAGLPLGVIVGMGRWDARKRISTEELAAGAVQVVVESRRLAGLARGVLTEAGADRVE
jgi:hypothetical protein